MQSVKTNDISKQIADDNLRRYTLSVNNNQEESVVENLQNRIKKMWLADDVTDFFVPAANEVTVVRGKKKIVSYKLYPWYVFIKMKMNDKIWYVVRNTPGVRLIIGAETTPIPLTEEEFENIKKQVEAKNNKISLNVTIKEWEVVVLQDTNFKGMKWLVKEVDKERWSCIVMVDFMWRTTPVNISLDKVQLDIG